MTNTLKNSNWNPQDPSMYSGVQLDSRKPTSYGMYVFKGWFNVDDQPTVTGAFLQSIQPPPAYYPELTKFWRWTEIDWEYVPYTKALFQERLSCTGELPNANCVVTACPEANGELTANGKAQVIGKLSGRPDINNWEQLLSETKGLTNKELLQKIKKVEQYDSLDKWSDFIDKIKNYSQDELAKALGKLLLLSSDESSNWFSFVNKVKLEPSDGLAGRIISILGHTDVIDFVKLTSKISHLCKNEFARQIGVALKLQSPVTSISDLADKIKATPKEEIENFPQELVSKMGIGKALIGKDDAKWEQLSPIINNIPIKDFQKNLNNLVIMINDFSKVDFVN